MIDLDAFEERAAVAEFDGGLSRFRAETLAAEMQGVTRWEALDAKRKRDIERGGDHGAPMAREQRADDVPGMQRGTSEEGRPVPKRDADTGRDSLALLALQPRGRGVL